MDNIIESKSYTAIPPGITLREILVDRNISNRELAYRTDFTEKHISNLLSGKCELTPAMANKLEYALGISADFWLNLEAIYRLDLEKVKEENQLDEEYSFVKKIPYSEICKLGWIPKTSDKKEKVKYLKKFFSIFSLDEILTPEYLKVSFRKGGTSDFNYSVVTWIQKVKIEAEKIDVNSIDLKGLERSLTKLRSYVLDDLSGLFNKLQQFFALYGIAFVVIPHLKGSKLSGVSFLGNKKIIIGVTLLGKDTDRFWFNIFHEVGHILLKHVFSDEKKGNEQEADEFARNLLIRDSAYKEFLNSEDFSKDAILKFSSEHGVLPGILIGRLQSDKIVPFNSKLNELKTRINSIEELL